MAHFDKNKVHEVARLARLTFSDDDATRYANELDAIFAWIDQLNEVNTDNEDPLLNISNVTMPQRDDATHDDSDRRAALLANAPMPLQDFFAVPKVIDTD